MAFMTEDHSYLKRYHCDKDSDWLPVNRKCKFMHAQDVGQKEDGEVQYWGISGQKHYIQRDSHIQEEKEQETTEKS